MSERSHGIGIIWVIQIIFIFLKAFNVLEWSWAVVFIPAYIAVGIWIICLIALGIIAFIESN